jgi:hypothetical protein
MASCATASLFSWAADRYFGLMAVSGDDSRQTLEKSVAAECRETVEIMTFSVCCKASSDDVC